MNTDFIKNKKIEDDSKELFSMLQVSWIKPKEEIWETISNQMKNTSVIQLKPKILSWQLAIAASLVLLLSIGTFLRTYTVTFEALTAQHKNTTLPDGSVISLNAGSKISYKPYWWWNERRVELQGEAYFEVNKGKAFNVESSIGITEVLGTSFNVYARGERYEVTCLTGKVKVQANTTKHTVILHPKEKASLQKTGQFKVEENVNAENSKAWISNKLVFTSELLKDVFEEIERQYNVEISVPTELMQRYTGNFEKTESIEDVLNLICRPFELKVAKNDNHHFQISN